MSDFESETEKTLPGRLRSDVAFREAMAGVQTRCNQLKTAIDGHDLEGVTRAGEGAADFWLSGQIACRRLLAGVRAASPYGDAARELLEMLYMRLLELLSLATTTIEVPWVQRILARARARLVAANREPVGAPVEVVTAGSLPGSTS